MLRSSDIGSNSARLRRNHRFLSSLTSSRARSRSQGVAGLLQHLATLPPSQLLASSWNERAGSSSRTAASRHTDGRASGRRPHLSTARGRAVSPNRSSALSTLGRSCGTPFTGSRAKNEAVPTVAGTASIALPRRASLLYHTFSVNVAARLSRVFSLLIERYVGSRGVSPEGSCDVTVASYSQQANHRVSYGGKYLGRRLSSYLTAVFVKCDILNPMQSVLDAPMLSRQFQQPSGSSLVRSKACHRIRDVPARLGPSAHRSLDSTYLRHVRPVGVPTQNL